MRLENKKILFVIARLNRGGTAKYIGELIPALIKQGIDVLIATGFVQGSEIEDSIAERIPLIRIKTLGRRISLVLDYKARREIKKVIKRYKPDLIYTHTFKAGFLTRTIFTQIPIIHAYHGHILQDDEHSKIARLFYKRIEQLLASRTKYIVVVGKRVGEDLKALKITSIPPGIAKISLPSAEESLKRLHLKRDRLKVAWLGRLEEVKKPSRVFELAQQIPEVDFLVAGDGSQKQEFKNSHLQNVIYLGWQDPIYIFSVSDVVLNTSLSEGMSISLIESQIAGLPAVAMDVGSNCEIIRHGITGYISHDFPEPFLTYLHKLTSEPRLRQKMAQSATDWATTEFSIELFVNRHIQLFNKCI
jgi:glycosyltransferase involved in cell wall biosynthesis